MSNIMVQFVVVVVAVIALAGCYVAPAGYGYSQPAGVYVAPSGGYYGGGYRHRYNGGW
jgi:hypothetical protein